MSVHPPAQPAPTPPAPAPTPAPTPVHLPTPVTIGLSLLAGLLTVLNTTTFHFISPWKAVLTVALVFIAGLGIGPLTGANFRNALHIPQNVNVVISSAFAAATIASTTITMSLTAHAIAVGVLTVFAGLGFGTAPTTVQ
jgi:hypothetical protein